MEKHRENQYLFIYKKQYYFDLQMVNVNPTLYFHFFVVVGGGGGIFEGISVVLRNAEFVGYIF